MGFTIDTKAVIKNVNVRKESHGDERVLADALT